MADIHLGIEDDLPLIEFIQLFNGHFSKTTALKAQKFFTDTWANTFASGLDTPLIALVTCALWHLAKLELSKTLPLNARASVPKLLEVIEELARTQADDYELSMEEAAISGGFQGIPVTKSRKPR